MAEKPWPGMSEEFSRLHGPVSRKRTVQGKPRLSLSDPVRHTSSTAPSDAHASNDTNPTAVVPPNSIGTDVPVGPRGSRLQVDVVGGDE